MATPGVEQKRPKFTPGVENIELLLATTMSHMATNWQPAAAAIPSTLEGLQCNNSFLNKINQLNFTLATIGTGQSSKSFIRLVHVEKTRLR